MATELVTGSVEGGSKLDKYLRELAVRLGQGGEARIGFLEGADYPVEQGGLPVAQVAFWNEFGTKFAPERPFFRNMIEEQMPTWSQKLGAAVRWTNYRLRPALEILAADIRGHLIESINILQDPPLSEVTIEKRKARYSNQNDFGPTIAKPLIDTKVMIRSTGWVVVMGAPTR